MKIENLTGAPGFILIHEDSRELLIDTDWDYPGVASAFGWSPVCAQVIEKGTCNHSSTDGTVKCQECGAGPSLFIDSAHAFLNEASDNGTEVEDPGYFSEEN